MDFSTAHSWPRPNSRYLLGLLFALMLSLRPGADARTLPPSITLGAGQSAAASCPGGPTGRGSLFANVSGGTPSYTIVARGLSDNTISSSATLATASGSVSLTGLTAQPYEIIATDANGGSALAYASVFGPAAFTVGAGQSAPTSCSGNNGSLFANVSGGTPSYTVVARGLTNNAISASATIAASGGSASLTGLTAQPYEITITDGNGCQTLAYASVFSTGAGAPPPPTLSASSSVVCEGTNVSVGSTGGSLGDSYQWYKDGVSLGTAQQTPTLTLNGVTPEQSGSYILVITRGCLSTPSSSNFILTVKPSPTVILLFSNSATVMGTGVPTITVPAGAGQSYQVLGGVAYSRLIEVDRVNGYLIRQITENTTGIFNIDRTGLFSITVTGANGCSRTVQGIIQIR